MSTTMRAPAVPGGRNIVRAALTGPQVRFAERHGSALRFRPTVAPFATVPGEPSASDWAHLAELAGERAVVLIQPLPPLPPGWTQVSVWPVFQMVFAARRPADPRDGPDAQPQGAHPGATAEVDLGADRVEELGRADVDAMRELVRLTRPGPFLPDTIELGRYLGIRRGGALVAMAGERFRVRGATEASAICTHPDHRGQGLSERLTRIVIDGILARGELPFLHVITENTPAVRLYEKLGFVVSLQFDAMAVRAPGARSVDTSELTVH